MLATNKFSIDINIFGDYFKITDMVLIFSLPGNNLHIYFLYIWCIYILDTNCTEYYVEKIIILSRRIHTKTQKKSDIFYLHLIALMPYQCHTKFVKTHLHCTGNDIETTS